VFLFFYFLRRASGKHANVFEARSITDRQASFPNDSQQIKTH